MDRTIPNNLFRLKIENEFYINIFTSTSNLIDCTYHFFITSTIEYHYPFCYKNHIMEYLLLFKYYLY
jgi:hypothetical protein